MASAPKAISEVGQGIGPLRDRLARYLELARLVFADSLWRYRNRLAVLLLIGGVALAMQAAALLAFVWYARKLEGRAQIEFAGMVLEATSSITLMSVAIVTGGVLTLLASSLRRYVEQGFYELASRYSLHCSERILGLASKASHCSSSRDVSISEPELRELATSRPILCSRVFNRLMSSLPLAASLLVFSGFLLYLDSVLTAAALLIVLVSSVFFYRLSVHVSSYIASREEKAKAMSADFRLLHAFMKTTNRPIDVEQPPTRDMVREGSFSAFFAQRFRTQTYAAQSMYLGMIVMALVLTMIGLVKGGQIITTGTGFGDLIVYLIAGRLAMNSAMGIMNALVRVNLYYPKVAGYFSVVRQLRQAIDDSFEHEPADIEGPFELIAKPIQAKEIQSQCESALKPGTVLGLVSPKPADRFAIQAICDGIGDFNPGKKSHSPSTIPPDFIWLVAEDVPEGLAVPFLTLTGLSDGTGRDQLIRDLAALGVPSKSASTIPGDLTASMSATDWKRLHRQAFWGASLLAAERSGRPFVVVGVETLNGLGKEGSNHVLTCLLSDRIVIVACRPGAVKGIGTYGADRILLFNGDELLGCMSVKEAKPDTQTLKELLQTGQTKDKLNGDLSIDDETL